MHMFLIAKYFKLSFIIVEIFNFGVVVGVIVVIVVIVIIVKLL